MRGVGVGCGCDVQWTWILSPATVGRLQSTAVTTSVLRCCHTVSCHTYAGACWIVSFEGLGTSLLMVSPASAVAARARMVVSFILGD